MFFILIPPQNRKFVASGAATTFAKDMWSDPPFYLFGEQMLAAYFLYPSRMYRSAAARLFMFVLVQIVLAGLLWYVCCSASSSFNPASRVFTCCNRYVTNLISVQGYHKVFAPGNSDGDLPFLVLYVMAAGLVFNEVIEFMRAVWEESKDHRRSGCCNSFISAVRTFPQAWKR